MSAMPSTPPPPYPDSPLLRALLGPPGQPVTMEYGPVTALSTTRIVGVITAALDHDGSPADPEDSPSYLIVDLLEPASVRAGELRWRRSGRTSPIRWHDVRILEYGGGGTIVPAGTPPRVSDPYNLLTPQQVVEAPVAVLDKYVVVLRAAPADAPDTPPSPIRGLDRVRAVGRLAAIRRKGPDARTVIAEFRLTDLVEAGTDEAMHAAHDHLDFTLDVRADDEVRVYDPV